MARRVVVTETLAPYRERSTLWWQGRSAREQRLLTILAIIAALVILVFLVVRPLQAARAAAFADIRTYETLNARLRPLATTPGGPAVITPQRSGTPEQIAGAAANSLGLQIQQTPGPSGTRVTIAEAPYATVMAWLDDIERTSPLTIGTAEIARRPTPGLVSARVDLTQ